MKILTIESPTHGTHHVLLDDDDYDRVVDEGKWYLSWKHTREVFYVVRKIPTGKNGKQKTILIHRFIMNAPKGMVVDHINGNGLDNRRENLRVCTTAENSRNRNVPPCGKVPYYGVSIGSNSKTKRYVAQAKGVTGTPRYLGYYYTAEEAALAYDKKVKELHGEFATLNFPDGPSPDVIQKIVEGQEEYQKIVKPRQAERQSKQRGVWWHKQSQRWRAVIKISGKQKHLGYFKTEQEAIDVRLAADQGIFPKRKNHPSPKQSSQPGVNWNKIGGKWRAVIMINGKRKHLGIFKTEQEAIDARLAAEISKHKQT